MDIAVIQLIILGVVIVLLATDKFPLYLPAMLGMCATFFLGCASFEEAFGGFANNSVIMMIGLYTIGNILVEVGLINKIGAVMVNLFTKGSRKLTNRGFNAMAMPLVALGSTVINAQLVVQVFHSIVDALSLKSPDFKRKYSYLPLSIVASYGVTVTSIASSTVVLSSGLLEQSSFGRGFTFFEPALIGIPGFLVCMIYFFTIGNTILRKSATFEDIPPTNVAVEKEGEKKDPKKMYLAAGIFVIALGFMIFSNYSLGPISLAAAAVMIVCGCIDPMKAIKTVPWQSVVLVACLLGIAKGMDVSGAGELAANFLINLCGPLMHSSFGVILVAFIVPNIVGSFMNNSAAAAIGVPIFLIVAENTGVPLLPVVLAAGCGCNLKVTTPTATHISISASAGYRFWDYVKVGGVLNILTILVCTAVLTFFLG